MIELGALLVASMIAMIGIIANAIRIDNRILREMAKKKSGKWNWD